MADLSVLLVMHELTMAGASRLALSVFRELKGRIDLRIVANRPGALRDEFAELGDLTVLRDGLIPGVSRRALGEREAQAIIEGVHGQTRSRLVHAGRRERRPDVLYLNSAAALPIYARMPWVRRMDLPTVLHVHELGVLLGEFERLAPGLLSTVPDRYVAVSGAVVDDLTGHYGVLREQISVVPAHVDRRWVKAGKDRPRDRDPHGPFVVGGSGIPSWTKGGMLWLLTAADLVRRHESPRFEFRWFGLDDSIASRQFKATVDKLDLGDSVKLVPFTDDPIAAYQAIDLMLVSSWEESASLVTLEAMALGKPVACFRGSGGPVEEVADAGLIVDGFSPTKMADAITEVATSEARLEALSAAAHRRVVDHYLGDDRAERIVEVIRAAAAA